MQEGRSDLSVCVLNGPSIVESGRASSRSLLPAFSSCARVGRL